MRFGNVELKASSSPNNITLTAATTQDGRTLSIIVEGAEIRDLADGASRFSSLSFDLEVEIVGDGVESCQIDFRGEAAHNGTHSFGIVRAVAGSGRAVVACVEEEKCEIAGRIGSVIAKPGCIVISLLLLTNAGNEAQNESWIWIDTLDLQLSSEV